MKKCYSLPYSEPGAPDLWGFYRANITHCYHMCVWYSGIGSIMETYECVHHVSECCRVHRQPLVPYHKFKRAHQLKHSLFAANMKMMKIWRCSVQRRSSDGDTRAHQKAPLYQRSSHWRQHVPCQDCRATAAPMLLVRLTKAWVNGASGG